MVESCDQVSQMLIQQATAGDRLAAERLFSLHRDRLRRMIAFRLDRRLSARVDPSDVLQEALAVAHRKLPEYLRTLPIPFYPWLRRIAWERITDLHRQHLHAQARTVTREEQLDPNLPEHSAVGLANRLVDAYSSPSRQVVQEELRERVRVVLGQLDPKDREILVLRYLEQLPLEEAAAVLSLSTEAVRSRQRRALERFSDLFELANMESSDG